EFGRTTIQIQTSKGPNQIVLGITEINPYHVKFKGLTHQWNFARSTGSFRFEELDPVIRGVIDENSQADRMAVARFYMLTQQFLHSLNEIDQIRQQFPELRRQIDGLEVELQTVWANQLLGDLEARQQSGQHEFALLATDQFLGTFRNLKPEILQRIRTIQDTEKKLSEELEVAKYLLGDLQAQLDDPDLLAQARLARTEILKTLDKTALPLLRPFLNFQNDESLSAREKLALAYSGWVLGPQNASTNFENSLRLWEARHLVLDYLRNSDPTRDAQLIQKIADTEGIGPTSLAALLESLPPIIETPGIVSSNANSQVQGPPVPQFLDLQAQDVFANSSIEYSAMLPIEYNQNAEYPLIVELRPLSQTRQKMLTWWGEQAARRGYIVVTPEYLDPAKTAYDYSVASHQAIERVLRDTMKRFRIDSSRVYLAGHEAGADAAFDFGMAHPDLFAGVIAISGECRYHCKATKNNEPNVPLYVVTGELDRGLLSRNADILNDLIRFGRRDIIYVEFMGRGNETYYEEIHRLFEWMSLHRLDRKQPEIDARITRPTEGRFHWLRADKLPAYIYTNDPATNGGRLQADTLWGHINTSDTVQSIYLKGPAEMTLFLTPEIFDFDKPLTIKRSRSGYTNKLVQPSLQHMLEDFRNRADRKNIVWAKIRLE
ncbi:MAG TPA: PHB depolymerase family esterase, partial [Planctomycetaceae bacterium]|nr:PHB depolymerase family esterase [Planctomycetaceae bacterium]